MTETVVKASPPPSYTQKLSLMAGSATVLYGLFPAAASAADIRYTPPNPSPGVTISFADGPSTVGWDVDGNGSNDFNLVARQGGYTSSIQLTSSGLSGRGFAQDILDADQDIRRLQFGRILTNTLGANGGIDYVWGAFNINDRKVLAFDKSVNQFFEPNLKPGQLPVGGGTVTSLIGFRFLGLGSEIYYGWAEIQQEANQGTPSSSRVTITRWAYNAVGCGAGVPLNSPCTNPGVFGSAIEVGNTGGGGTPTVPEPTSPLALLALGAAGVYRWRKERQGSE